MLDPYATLQVDRDASPDEVKRAYRRLAKELHPDLNPGNPASARRFKDVTAAYDVLSDEEKRRQYDREAATAAAMAGAARARGQSRTIEEDELDSFFANRGWGFRKDQTTHTGPRRRGADIYQSLKIDFAEAALGARKRVTVNDGRTLEVLVPPLTQDGQQLRLKGQGGPGQNGGVAGDVFVEITVESHPIFVRKDNDIQMSLPVTVPEAVLGATVTVPTIHGAVQLKIPVGANTDTVLRLRGKGLPTPQGGFGDQYVSLKVILPDAKDPDWQRLIEGWARTHNYRVR